MSRAGGLSRRVVLEAPIEVPDGAGGVTRTYADAATLWAEVTPLVARAAERAGAVGADVAYRIVIRSGPDVTTAHRLRLGARVLTIASLREHDRSGRYLQIDAVERRD